MEFICQWMKYSEISRTSQMLKDRSVLSQFSKNEPKYYLKEDKIVICPLVCQKAAGIRTHTT